MNGFWVIIIQNVDDFNVNYYNVASIDLDSFLRENLGVVLFYKYFLLKDEADLYKNSLVRLTPKSLISLIKEMNPGIDNLKSQLEQNIR